MRGERRGGGETKEARQRKLSERGRWVRELGAKMEGVGR